MSGGSQVWTAAGPLLGASVGFAASYLGDWGKDKRAERRETAARSLHKGDTADAFELENLKACSIALGELTSLVGREFFDRAGHAVAAVGGTHAGDVEYGPIEGVDVNAEPMPSAVREIERLQDLILSGDTRQAVRIATQMLSILRQFRGPMDSAMKMYQTASIKGTEANAAIAARTRELYGGDR